MMKKYLSRFKEGKLHFDDLVDLREELAEDIRKFYSVLPESMRQMEAHDEHTKTLDFKSVPAVDHGWDHAIPVMRPEFAFKSAENRSLQNA